jgi:hypothetical protein
MESTINQISEVVKNNRLVSDRVAKLRSLGFNVEEKPMGSGGVLQVKKLSSETRVQIGYGHGRNNYAMAVVL